MNASMATKSTTAGNEGQRVLALWVLWVALFLLLAAAGVAVVAGIGDDPGATEPTPALPLRTGALNRLPDGTPPAERPPVPVRRVAMELLRKAPGGAAVPYLGPAAVTSLGGTMLTARAGVPVATSAGFVIEADQRRAVVRASGFHARTFAIDDRVTVILEPDAAVRLRLQGLPPTGSELHCEVAEDGVALAAETITVVGSVAEWVVPVASGRRVDLAIAIAGRGLSAQWRSPPLQLRAGEVRGQIVDPGELPITVLQVRGPTAALLAGMTVALERDERPWVRLGEAALDGNGVLALRGMTGDRLRAFVVGTEPVPLLPVGTATPEFACGEAPVVVQPEQSLVALRLRHADADAAFTLRVGPIQAMVPRPQQVLRADVLAAGPLGACELWSAGTGGLLADLGDAIWAGDVGTLPAVLARRTGTVRIALDGPSPWWAAQLRLWVVEAATGRTHERPVTVTAGGGEVVFTHLQPGIHRLGWSILGQAGAHIVELLQVAAGEQTVTPAWPEIDVWIGEIADWPARDAVRAAVAVEVGGRDVGGGNRVWADAAGTFRLLRPRGQDGLPPLALTRDNTAAVPLQVDAIDPVARRLRVRAAPSVHWVRVHIHDGGIVEWHLADDSRCHWRSRGEDRVPVPAGGRLFGVLRTQEHGVAALVAVDASVAAVDVAPNGLRVALGHAGTERVRLSLLGPTGYLPIAVAEMAPMDRRVLFVPEGVAALRVEHADGSVQELAIAAEIVIN